MDIGLNNKRALVCGSTSGIGKAIAMEFASMGAQVTLLARNEQKLIQTMHELPNPGSHQYLVADFTNPDAVRDVIQHHTKNFEVHILLNNSGGPAPGSALQAKPEEYIHAFQTHLVCNQIITQACVPSMKEGAYGRIINVISSSVKVPIPGLGVSNTIRAAVANWAKTLASELAPFQITVNNLLPGLIMTGRVEALVASRAAISGRSKEEEMKKLIEEIPAGRIGDLREIAAAAGFLASPSASYITGINLPVDGGRTPSL